jgi:hypothetical protein
MSTLNAIEESRRHRTMQMSEFCKYPSPFINQTTDSEFGIINCPEIVTLIVGPAKSSITCHRALLCYFAEFFDATLFGRFVEAASTTLELPEDAAEDIAAFVTWAYTGHITSPRLIELWVLGQRLQSPKLSNDCMRMMFNKYWESWMVAEEARYSYENTMEGSKLRQFIKDLIQAEGPLCEECVRYFEGDKIQRSSFQEDWKTLIKEGGDLVFDVVKDGSFGNKKDSGYCPYFKGNQLKYLLEVTGRPIEDFIAGKMRGDTR